jgi:hypothetical protein
LGDFTGLTTLIGPRELKVTLEEVKFKHQPKGGRRLFELKGHGLDNRLFLAIPPKGSTTYRLVTADKEGKAQDVLLLEAEASFGGLFAEAALGEDKTVKVEQEWKGGSDKKKDNDAWKQAPQGGVIAGPRAWEKLWKAWQFAKELPKVDFEKDLILVAACPGPNSIVVDLKLSDKGDLKFQYGFTEKDGPGFRYRIMRVSRAGIKTVGKKIPKD